MSGFIKQTFIVPLLVLLCFFYHAVAKVFSGPVKCVSMKNQQFKIRLTLIDLNLDELHYHSFIISINRCHGSCNTVEDPFCRICVHNRIEDLNLKVLDPMDPRYS